jgi:hypothetical protein
MQAEGQVVAASLEVGAGVSAVARQAGIHPSQLYGWRRIVRTSAAGFGQYGEPSRGAMTDWKPFPDPANGDFIVAPFGPGCYELRLSAGLISLLLAARTIMFRNITKVFVRLAYVALIASMVQLSLISTPSVQTISAQTAREAQTLVEKIEELKNSERHADAIPLQQRLLAITEMALGPDHPDVPQSLNNLGRLYGRQGRYADAE